jgi:hypothetical protein
MTGTGILPDAIDEDRDNAQLSATRRPIFDEGAPLKLGGGQDEADEHQPLLCCEMLPASVYNGRCGIGRRRVWSTIHY